MVKNEGAFNVKWLKYNVEAPNPLRKIKIKIKYNIYIIIF